MRAEYRDGKIVIGDYECRPQTDVPAVIADFFLAFQTLEWHQKEELLMSVGYGEKIGHGMADVAGMTEGEYSEHLDRSLLISIIDNEGVWWENKLSQTPTEDQF